MLLKLIKAERMKLKRSPVWLAFLLMPVVPAVLGTLNYLNNLGILKGEWYSLWTQHTLFTCYFFLPVMVGVYCSYLMRQEQNQHNWNRVLSLPVPRGMVFVAKMVCASLMILLSEIWIAVLFVFSGTIVGLTSPPVGEIAIWCLFGTLGGMVMASLQLVVSLFVRSFAVPVGISLAGGISGLIFLAKGLGHIWPYSLMAYGMNSNSPQQLMESGYAPFVAACAVFIAVFVAAGSAVLSRRDV